MCEHCQGSAQPRLLPSSRLRWWHSAGWDEESGLLCASVSPVVLLKFKHLPSCLTGLTNACEGTHGAFPAWHHPQAHSLQERIPILLALLCDPGQTIWIRT